VVEPVPDQVHNPKHERCGRDAGRGA
jgi:hypothetical protein